MTASRHVVIIGAGMGGLTAAADLARQGVRVTVLEKAAQTGGKIRAVAPPGAAPGDSAAAMDAGPTVFTMRWVFEALFAACDSSLDASLRLTPANILARHAWPDRTRLDLLADPAHGMAAIEDFAGSAEARRYAHFLARARQLHDTLLGPFMAAERPSSLGLAARLHWSPRQLAALQPWRSMWSALGDDLHDPRLRQLFGRYATYCGGSPMRAPATLMLVAHVEQQGVWLPQGGMRALADAVTALARRQGAEIRCGVMVQEILVRQGRAAGVRLQDGATLTADAVLFNGDHAALAPGLLGAALRRASHAVTPQHRSLSAITWTMRARALDFPLAYHNVFFSADYAAEFRALFAARQVPQAPTVYLCAPDQGGAAAADPSSPQRVFMLINAPADGGAPGASPADYPRHFAAARAILARCGLELMAAPEDATACGPAEFAALFPGSGGALYGAAPHGAMASFRRPGAVSHVPGLYFAGGSVHPGPGVPMAALSGRLAASRIIADFSGLQRRHAVRVATPPPAR